MSLLDHKDWFDIILEDTKINENDEIFESRNKINKFKSIELNENNLKKFKNTYKNLSHVRIDDSTIGKLFIDNDNVVGMINIKAKPNGEKWIQGLEIFGKYKGTGLSLGLLDIGVKDLGAKYLSVRKTNTIAQKIYKKYGFTVYKSDDYMDYMKLSGYAKESPEFEDESVDFITENLLLNKKDLEINLDKFESGKSNVLLITGFSGSGKSTLASQLTSKYKCIHYELDCLDFYLGKTMTKEDAVGNEDGLVAFIDKKKLEPGLNLNNNELNELYREYIKFLINYCKSQKDKKFIIEGLQIYGVYQEGDTFITSCPMIIKGTSGIVSAIRAAKRNNGSFSKEFGPLIKWVLKDDKALNKLKKDIEGENMNESAKPKKCSQCGSEEIGTFIEGEPIYKCKKCGKYLGTVPFPNNTKESPEFDSVESDEIVEEGFKDIINKIKNRKNKNTLVKPEEIIESGYKTLSKDLINSLSEDAKWINSELTKEFNKIKNNFIIDEISVKYSDIVKINSIDIKENYHKENGKYRAVVLSDLLYCDGTPAYGIPHQKLRIDEDSLLEQVMNKVDTEFTGIIENIKSTYNKKHNNEKFRFLIDREYKEFKRPILTIVLVYESTLSKSDNSYKESVTDNFNDFELDYIFGNITESEYNRIKEENAIGQMLPQVPLNGETLSKTPDVESDVENLDNFINDADGVLKGEINNYVKEYVTDSDSSYDIYIESEISSLARTLSYKFKIPKKHAAILVKKAIFKNKCKMLAKKNTDRNDMKLVDAKKRLIDEEQEYRKMMKSMDEETKKQIESVSKKIEDEVEDSIDDIDVSLDDNSTTNNKKDNKVRKNLSIKDDDKYIKDIDEQLKSLEKEKPVKEENEDNKDFTRRLKKYEDKRYNLEMKKAKLQANFMKEYVDENPVNLYTSEPEYSLIIERQELESSLKKAQELNNLESIRKYENKLKANELRIMKESVDINEVVLLEAAPIEDEIKDIIDVLREKGYHTKYSSPGHHHLRRKEDADHNGVYNGKLYSDARLMFDDDYKSIPDAPKYWYTRLVDDKTYLDVKPITYNSNDGTPDEAFAKWKDKYMTSLREWANEIGKKPGPKEKSEKDDEVTKESPEFDDINDDYQDFCESVFEDLDIDLALDI